MNGLRGFGGNLLVLIKMVIHAGVEFNDRTANPVERCQVLISLPGIENGVGIARKSTVLKKMI